MGGRSRRRSDGKRKEETNKTPLVLVAPRTRHQIATIMAPAEVAAPPSPPASTRRHSPRHRTTRQSSENAPTPDTVESKKEEEEEVEEEVEEVEEEPPKPEPKTISVHMETAASAPRDRHGRFCKRPKASSKSRRRLKLAPSKPKDDDDNDDDSKPEAKPDGDEQPTITEGIYRGQHWQRSSTNATHPTLSASDDQSTEIKYRGHPVRPRSNNS